MRIFLEGSSYALGVVPNSVRLYFNGASDGFLVTDHVGYYNDYKGEVVLFIPKVFEPIFSEVGQEFIDCCSVDGFSVALRNSDTANISVGFLSKFVFIFQLSLVKYLNRCHETVLLSDRDSGHIAHNLSTVQITEFEIVASLMDFYVKHRDLIKFKTMTLDSHKPNRIDWPKTIKKSYPVHDDDNAIYTKFIVKSDQHDASDELLVIYNSLLKYFRDMYGFKVEINQSYSTLKTRNFERFCHSSKKTLKRIKGKYFDDRLKRLYKLLSVYFGIHDGGGKSINKKEYLFVRGYEIVFEDMIDYLISKGEVADRLKNNDDGKIIDHLYKYDSLIDDDEIFYIGDSKYYKQSTSFGRQAIYKQFTYAKNVIQYNVNLFNDGESCCVYRDDLTEGYNISPNFFIQAYIDDLNILSPKADFSSDTSLDKKSNYHFSNRIFDRDSLRLCSFKINFLFVLKSYVMAKPSAISKFRDEAHLEIRRNFIDFYNSEYDFYKVKIDDVEGFVNANFKSVNGKLYRSGADLSSGTLTLGLASSGFNTENKKVLNLLSNASIDRFFIK
jgi:hypothetical protein